MIIFEMLKMRR